VRARYLRVYPLQYTNHPALRMQVRNVPLSLPPSHTPPFSLTSSLTLSLSHSLAHTLSHTLSLTHSLTLLTLSLDADAGAHVRAAWGVVDMRGRGGDLQVRPKPYTLNPEPYTP